MSLSFSIIVIGGGAAGFFAAIQAAKTNPLAKIFLLEKSNALLSKVRISGGGRCNVTHACFDPQALVKNYPRGEKALLGPFQRFQPQDTIHWFESRGVKLKTESDGRIFPVSDQSQTIIDCLLQEARERNVQILLQHGVKNIQKKEGLFRLEISENNFLYCQKLIIAAGGNKNGFELAASLGHHIISPVPSLFTFNIPNFGLKEFAGISVEVADIKLLAASLNYQGPLLITHWGFSGPAILKLSAWGARFLHDAEYQTPIQINWLPYLHPTDLAAKLLVLKQQNANKTISNQHDFPLPKQMWKYFIELVGIESHKRWCDVSNKQLNLLAAKLQFDSYEIKGKTTHKQEFVTCGGVSLKEINFKTLESRLCPGLYFAGEIIDIDGITGGFNFQNAWTTGWIAGQSAANIL